MADGTNKINQVYY